jgi:TetR/AcrR family transcriptional repressor of nem operon
LFHSRSYAGVGVNELCEHAGVKKGSFYHYFPSKSDLTSAALDEVARSYKRDIYEPAFATDLPPLERIQRLFQLIYEYHVSLTEASGRMGGCHFGNLAMELSTQDEVIREKVKGLFESTAAVFEQVLREAVDSGDLPAIDESLAAHALLAYLEGVILLAKTWNDPDMVRRLAQGALLLATVGSD